MARFPNLGDAAGQEFPNECAAELKTAGIEVLRLPSKKLVGTLGPWVFERCWYYWSARSDYGMPLPVADALHVTHRETIRAEGDCACRGPRFWGKGFAITLYHIDDPESLRVFAAAVRSVLEEAHDG